MRSIRVYDWRLVIPPTYGAGGHGAIYDLLRKRSYRKWKREEKRAAELWDEMEQLALNDRTWDDLYAELESYEYGEWEHQHYIRGVRDALALVVERLAE